MSYHQQLIRKLQSKQRILKLAGSFLLLLTLAWFAKSQGEMLVQAARNFLRPKVLVEGVVGQPHLINPLYADLNPTDKLLSSLIYQGLIRYNQEGLPEGDLAEKWEVLEEGKVYQVTVKDNVYFHDGQKLTAQDVVFTYQLTQLPEYQGPKKGFFEGVEITLHDEQTVLFTLKGPLSSFFESLKLGVLPKHLWQDLGIKEILQSQHNLLPIGTGPAHIKEGSFKINSQNQIKALVLSLDAGQLNQIQLKFYPDEKSLLVAFKLGEIDSFVLKENGVGLSQQLSAWPKLNKVERDLLATQYLLLFNESPPDEVNLEVKELLGEHSFRESLRGLVDEVMGDELSLGPIPSASWAFEAVEMERASEILGPIPELTLNLPQKPQFLHLAQAIQQVAKEASVNFNLETLSSEEFRKKVLENRDFQVLLLGRSISYDPDQYVYWHSSQNSLPGLNLSSFSNRRVDKALEEARKEFDREQRKKYYRDFQQVVASEIPAIFVAHERVVYYFPERLKAHLPEVWWEEGDRLREINKWRFE